MTALLSVRDLGVRYTRDANSGRALSQINFDLARGERLAIIGESGSGKTSLALAIAGLLSTEAAVTGSIDWPGIDMAPHNGRDIGFVFQDPAGSLDPLVRVGEQVGEVLRAHLDLNAGEAQHGAVAWLQQVRLPSPDSLAKAYPHQLSGGQQQRVAIACALAAEPLLLIADEATSALDTVVQSDIVQLVLSLAQTRNMSVIWITHDISVASQVGERMAVLRDGQLVEIGEVSQTILRPNDDYTRELVSAHIALDSPRLVDRGASPRKVAK